MLRYCGRYSKLMIRQYWYKILFEISFAAAAEVDLFVIQCDWELLEHKRKKNTPPCDAEPQTQPVVLTHRWTFISLVWHVKIFLTSRTTQLSVLRLPPGSQVSVATACGSSCYYHQCLTSRPCAFTLCALMDSLLSWQTGQSACECLLCRFISPWASEHHESSEVLTFHTNKWNGIVKFCI